MLMMRFDFNLLKLPEDQEPLVEFLSREEWPFHVNSRLNREQVLRMLQEGSFTGSDHRTFWITTDQGERVGLIRLFDLNDLDDGSPLFDLRLAKAYRNQGIGRLALQWITAYFFETWPSLERVEGTTRVDNRAMRKLFRGCGYAKEGHFRQSWRDDHGKRYDTVSYGILKCDWASNSVTPVNFYDEEDD